MTMKLQMIGLAALLAGTLCASEPEAEEIKRQNQYVEYRLSQGEIYRIYVKMNDGVTTVQFPSAITEIAGKNVSADGKNADSDFLIQAQAGSYYFNIAAIKKGATGTLTVTHNRKLYILYLIQSDKEAYASVVFGRSSNRKNLSGPVVTVTPKVTPARLVSLIDMAKKYDVLAENHPEAVAGCERVKFKNRYRCGKFDIHLLDATRFEDEDTVIFHVELENLTHEEIAYDKHSFSAHAGNRLYYMSVSDASGLMPPKSKTHAWFGITSTPEGGRNNLKADNDWLLALTTREMHTSQLQSTADLVKAEREKMNAQIAARNKQNLAAAAAAEKNAAAPAGAAKAKPAAPVAAAKAKPVAPVAPAKGKAVPAVAKGKAPAAPAGKTVTSYKVQPHDTLIKISMKCYGTKRYYHLIVNANRGKIGPNNQIRIGQTLVIPPKPQK